MASDCSPERIVGYALVGGVALAAVFKAACAVGTVIYDLGEDYDLWGGPNPETLLDSALEEYNESFALVNDMVRLDESFLQTVAEKQVDRWKFRLAADQLKLCKWNLLHCLYYLQKSSRYGAEAIKKSQINEWIEKVTKRADFLLSVANYIESHSDYFSLYKEEIRCSTKYAHEQSLYEAFVYQPNVLKAELYATAGGKYGHAYAIVDYAQELNADMIDLAKVINVPYMRASSVRRLYDILQKIHTFIINDHVFVQTAQQYAYWQEEQKRLERIAYERREQADRERKHIEAVRITVERERQRACEIHAGYQYVNGYYNGQADASWQTYEAQQCALRAEKKAERLERERRAEARKAEDARNDANRHQQNAEYERAKADRERTEKDRLEREKNAEDRRKRAVEEQQREERKRQEQEAENKRIAEQQEAARREVERHKIEAEKAAQREAERKEEEARYNTFDRFQ